MLLITGATGNLGGLIIDQLLQKNPNLKFAALARSEEKAQGLRAKGVEVRIGTYYEPETLDKAFQDVDTLLLISGSEFNDRVGQHRNAIEAAKRAGVGHILYTSIVQADKRLTPLAYDHADTEDLIKASGIPYTIFRNTFYLEFFPALIGNALESGRWANATAGKPQTFALRTEMAEAIANVLLDPEAHKNTTYEITTAEAYTFHQVNEALGQGGRSIQYNDLSTEDLTGLLTNLGLPAEAIGQAGFLASVFQSGALNHTGTDLERLLGRKPQDLKDAALKV